MLVHCEIRGVAARYGARFLSVSRQVRAHLWHVSPVRGFSGILTQNFSTLACLEVQALLLSYLLLPSSALMMCSNCDKYR